MRGVPLFDGEVFKSYNAGIKMTLIKKLLISYAVIIAISTIITIVATVRLHNLNEFTLTITNQVVPALMEEKKAEVLFYNLRNIVKKYRIFPGAEFREYFFKKIDQLRDVLDSLKDKVPGENEKQIIEKMKKELEDYRKLFQINITEFTSPDKELEKKFKKSEEHFSELSLSLVNETEKILQEKLEESSRMKRNTSRFIWSILLISVIVMAIVVAFFAHYLTYSIRRLQRGARKIASGDFNYELSIPEDDEVGELTADFNAMAKKLRDMEEVKAHFMTMVLHDLKGPITAMKGSVTLLLEKKETFSSQQRDSLELVNHEIEHLNRLVDDLNEVAHIDSGIFKIIRAPFSLQRLLGELVVGMQPVLQEASLKIDLMVDSNIPEINGDRDRIKQVFSNLVANASHFSPKSGIIRVSAEAKSDRVFCQVTDSGPGISEEKGKHIFDKFKAGDSAPSKRVGSGLGLYIAKKILDFHGGRIWFQSTKGKGTTFYFSLPYL